MEVSLKVRLGLVAGREVLVGVLELLSVLDHSLDLLGRKSANRVLDGDLSLSARGTVLSRDLEETVSVNLEGTNKLGLASGHRGDTRKLELSKKSVVLALGSLTLVDREHDGSLVVLDSGEDSRLVGGDGGVSGENNTEDVTLHGNTKRERGDIEEKKVGGLVGSLTGEDGSLDGGTVSNSLVGVDGLVELTTTKVLGDERLDLGDTGRTTNKDNVVNLGGRDLGVLEDLLYGVNGRLESDGVDLLEPSTGDVGREVGTLVERVDLDGGLSNGRESSLSTLTSRSQSSQSTGVVRDVKLGLPLELSLEVLKEVVVEVLTTKMSVTSSGLDREDLALNGKKRDIESTTTQVEDEDVSLLLGLLVKTVGNSGSSRFVDNTEHLKTGNGTGVLSGETLRVVEVGRNAFYKVSPGYRVHLINTHVTTAFLTVLPILASAISFILVRTMAEISWGEKVFFSLR